MVDLAANWWAPGGLLDGTNSRFYDVLTGHGGVDGWIRRANWPMPPAREAFLSVFDRPNWVEQKRPLLARAGSATPRMIWQRWGNQPQQWATQWQGRSISLGTSGAFYWNMDRVLTVNWAGGGTVVGTMGFFDGRGEPYGKSKIAAGPAHSKSLHLMPFIASAQRCSDALYVN